MIRFKKHFIELTVLSLSVVWISANAAVQSRRYQRNVSSLSRVNALVKKDLSGRSQKQSTLNSQKNNPDIIAAAKARRRAILKEQTPDLFSLKHETVSFSKNDKVRCEIIWLLKNKCDKYKLGVSLTSAKGLKTRSPKNPINFWWYTPQHDNDKAPTKKKCKIVGMQVYLIIISL